MVGGRGVLEMMMVDDLGGVGVQKRPFCDDVICEQPHQSFQNIKALK